MKLKNNNTFIFLRHGQTLKDPRVTAVEWGLTDEAKSSLNNLIEDPIFEKIDHLYSSTESKAKKTAEPFAKKFSLKVEVLDGLDEVHRGEVYLSDDEFKRLKQEKLEDRDSNLDRGETSNEALSRFINAISEIDSKHHSESILVVSHGTVLALFFSHIKNDFSNIFDYWENMEFCAIGIIKGGEIVKDISS